jgi:hypothetical protein
MQETTMARKTAAARLAEIQATLNAIDGTGTAWNSVNTYVTSVGVAHNLHEVLHLGKWGGKDKAARNCIRAAMLLVWANGGSEHDAHAIKKLLGSKSAVFAEGALRKLWESIEQRLPLAAAGAGARMAQLTGNARQLMRNHTILPSGAQVAHGGDHFKLFQEIAPAPAETWAFAANCNDIGVKHMRLTQASLVAPAIQLEVVLAAAANTSDFHFLPWGSLIVTKYEIPAVLPGAPLPPGNPGLFFTAALGGCSVFISGTKRNPSIYHLGADPIDTVLQYARGTHAWPAHVTDRTRKAAQEMLSQFKPNAEDRKIGYHQAVVRFWRELCRDIRFQEGCDGYVRWEVSKLHYSHGKTISEKIRNMKIKLKTVIRRRGQNWEDFEPYCQGKGCVFGIRDAHRNWAFYLQENFSFAYPNPVNPHQKIYTAVPIGLKKIFPDSQDVSRGVTWPDLNRTPDAQAYVVAP